MEPVYKERAPWVELREGSKTYGDNAYSKVHAVTEKGFKIKAMGFVNAFAFIFAIT